MGALVRFYGSIQTGPVAVAKDPAAFVRETRDVVAALKHRICREDRELYDLIDRAGMASAA